MSVWQLITSFTLERLIGLTGLFIMIVLFMTNGGGSCKKIIEASIVLAILWGIIAAFAVFFLLVLGLLHF